MGWAIRQKKRTKSNGAYRMNKKEFRKALDTARKKDPRRLDEITTIYATTDMDWDEYAGWVKHIADMVAGANQ